MRFAAAESPRLTRSIQWLTLFEADIAKNHCGLRIVNANYCGASYCGDVVESSCSAGVEISWLVMIESIRWLCSLETSVRTFEEKTTRFDGLSVSSTA